MRLITHNMLQCHVKGCNANNFPLELQEVVLEQEEAELNEDFLRNMLNKIEYDALVATCLKVNLTTTTASTPSTAAATTTATKKTATTIEGNIKSFGDRPCKIN